MIKVKLPDFEDLQRPFDTLTKEEIKARMKERGLLPDRPWVDNPVYISSTASVFEPYVPPEGDGKVSAITPQVCVTKHSRFSLGFIKNYFYAFGSPCHIFTYLFFDLVLLLVIAQFTCS